MYWLEFLILGLEVLCQMPQDVTQIECGPYGKVQKELKTVKKTQISLSIYHKCLQSSNMR